MFLNLVILSIVFLFEKSKNRIYSIFGYDLVTSIVGNAPVSSGRVGGLTAAGTAPFGAVYNYLSAQQNREHKNARIQTTEENYRRQLEMAQQHFSEGSAEQIEFRNQDYQQHAADLEDIRRLTETGDITEAFFGALGAVHEGYRTEAEIGTAQANQNVEVARSNTHQHIARETGLTVREGIRAVNPLSNLFGRNNNQNQNNTSDS